MPIANHTPPNLSRLDIDALQAEIDAHFAVAAGPVLPRTAGIRPANQRPERPRFFQRIGQAFQSLRACSTSGVLSQVNTAPPPAPETVAANTAATVLNTAPAAVNTVVEPTVLNPSILALRAIERISPSFIEENSLNVQMGQLLASRTFQERIDHILWRRSLGSHSVRSEQFITHLNLVSINGVFSQAIDEVIAEPTSIALRFHARFSARSSETFLITHSQYLSDHLIFSIEFNSRRALGNLAVSLTRQPAMISMLDGLLVTRGQEFNILGRALRSQPEKQIDQVQYQNNGRQEGAIDMGGPLRECFTQAYEQALNALMKDTSLQGARKDIDPHLDVTTIDTRRVPKVNLPPHLFEQSFLAILTLAKYSHDLAIKGQVSSLSDFIQSARQALYDHRAILVDIVESLFPEIKAFLETHFDDPLAKYAYSSEPTPEDASALLSEYLSDHLEETLGLCYSSESDTVTIAEGNSRFLQLALIANGFEAVREARTHALSAAYPVDIKRLATRIKGSGDFRRALSDPHYEKAFRLVDESQSMTAIKLNLFKNLIHQWAGKASDQQLSALCRTMIGSDVLPDHISNGTNRLMIQIKNIPVMQPTSGQVVGYAEFNPHTCFGTLEIAPHIVEEILAEYRQSPEQIPLRLERLLGQELPSESRAFNAP
jgi:hypothetical protein